GGEVRFRYKDYAHGNRKRVIDGRGHLPPAGAERAGLPHILLRGSSEWPSDPLPLASDATEGQSRLIPATPRCGRLPLSAYRHGALLKNSRYQMPANFRAIVRIAG